MTYFKKEIDNSDYQNDWANNIKGESIHIDNAKSGLRGYYCKGCDKKMQAVKSKNPKRKSYFRHHANNTDKEYTKCVIASRVYRESLAKTIINRLKYVKVPALYKYPPKGEDGLPMFLKEKKEITTKEVKSELTFYEDENGIIHWGKNPQIDKRFLLIRPDVTFFDKKGKPILFIEFVITHKITDEKKTILSRLGIDTVQIIIPKVPEEQIEKALKSSQKYKWVYNDIEANTTYVQVPRGNSKELSSIDEDQRKLFEESYSCRANKVNELVRHINKCLRSKSYNRTEQLFESEISRVTGNREQFRERLEELEESNRKEALGRNSQKEKSIESESVDLEKRYIRKEKEFKRYTKEEKEKLEKLERKHSNSVFKQYREIEDEIKSRRRGIAELYADLEERYLRKEKYYRKQYERETNKQDIIERVAEKFKTDSESEKRRINRIRGEYENLEKEVQESIRSETEFIERRIEEIGRQQESVENIVWKEFERDIEFEESEIKKIGGEEIEIERKEKNIKTEVREEFNEELKNNPSKLPERIKTLLAARRMGDDFKDIKRKEILYKRAKQFFNKGTWEKR